MNVKSPWIRLQGGHFWQAVDRRHNEWIRHELGGCHKILDIGCGYGSLSAYLAKSGFEVYGIDADSQSIETAKCLFPELCPERMRTMDAESLDFPDDYFDGIALRDTLHHIFEEGSTELAFSEMERVLRPGGRLVIFDPNPNFVLLFCRWLIRHQDARCSFSDAIKLLLRRNWIIQNTFFTDAFALALSGGYVGPCLMPKWKFLQTVTVAADRTLCKFIQKLGLGQYVLWRYGITARPPNVMDHGASK
jgi:SAM-dependent methyltransferase